MSWQEELRKLDEELASGRLSADDYRVRRDQVLSSAVAHGESNTPQQSAPQQGGAQGATPAAPQQFSQQQAPAAQQPTPSQPQQAPQPQQSQPQQSHPQQAQQQQVQPQQQQSQPQQQAPQAPAPQQGQSGADSTQIIAPIGQQPQQAQQPQGQQPQGQQPQGQPQNQPQPSAEATQVVSAHDLSADRTQAVPAWQTQPPPYQPPRQHQAPPSPPDGFQQPNSPAGGFQQPGPHQQQAPQQPWNAPDQDLSPPWGGSDFPPIAPSTGADWAKQGPEVFDERPSKSKGSRVAILSIVGLLVLAGLGVGGYFLFGNSGDTPPGPDQTQAQEPAPPPQSTTTTPASPNQQILDKIAKLPGQADKNSGLLALGQLTEFGILDGTEVELLDARAVEEVAWKGSQKSPDESGPKSEKFSIMVVPLTNSATAGELADQVRQLFNGSGFTLIPGQPFPELPEAVVLHKQVVEGQPAKVYRGTWVSGDNLVRVDVRQEPNEDEAALSGQYQRAVKSLLEKFPVS